MGDLFLGVDLGGTSIKASLSDKEGQCCVEQAIPTEAHLGPEHVLERIASLGKSLLEQADSGELKGCGVGVPGLVDIPNGITKFLPNLHTQWRDIPVGTKLSGALGVPVFIMNDVRTATQGELIFGHGKGNPRITMAFFSIGTGIGGGIAIDGKLRLGKLGAAGELGHQTIVADGPLCGCGNRGCLEAIASGTAIAAEGVRLMRSGQAPALQTLVDNDANLVSASTMSQVAEQDPKVQLALVHAATSIGIGAANIITALHPELVVLGGGVAEIGSLLLDTVRSVIAERVKMFPVEDIRIENSLLGERAGVMGAVSLGIQAASSAAFH